MESLVVLFSRAGVFKVWEGEPPLREHKNSRAPPPNYYCYYYYYYCCCCYNAGVLLSSGMPLLAKLNQSGYISLAGQRSFTHRLILLSQDLKLFFGGRPPQRKKYIHT